MKHILSYRKGRQSLKHKQYNRHKMFTFICEIMWPACGNSPCRSIGMWQYNLLFPTQSAGEMLTDRDSIRKHVAIHPSLTTNFNRQRYSIGGHVAINLVDFKHVAIHLSFQTECNTHSQIYSAYNRVENDTSKWVLLNLG
jgi:hypothetical protein